jgi:hypothetical protein
MDFRCNTTAPVSAKEAFEKICRVSEWWAADFTGSAQKLGDVFTVRFDKTWVDFEITEFVPHERIVWKVIDSNLNWLADKKEWNGTSVVFEIAPTAEETRVTMTHIGLVPEIECYGECEKGWTHFVTTSLRQFLADGLAERRGLR